MGFRPNRSLLRVELPLAVPYILAGIRVAASKVIGLVSVTALIGLGGLGQLFVAGLQGSDSGPPSTSPGSWSGSSCRLALAAAADAALGRPRAFRGPLEPGGPPGARTARPSPRAAPVTGADVAMHFLPSQVLHWFTTGDHWTGRDSGIPELLWQTPPSSRSRWWPTRR